jgi:neurofibromin 1
MASICPSSEVDELAVCLLTVFEQRGLIFELLEALIKQEVEDTGNIAIFPITQSSLRLIISRKRI